MATYNNEDNIKWNDLATSLQDIIMRKITWNMLHPDLQSWLLDKERRIIELERWRRTKADPMLDDHERRIGNCESQISSLWSKLGDTEDDINDMKHPPGHTGPNDPGFSGNNGYFKFPNGFIAQWGAFPREPPPGKNDFTYHRFIIPFPNKVMALAGSPIADIPPRGGGMNEFNWLLTIVNKSTFASYHDGACGFTWIAFGY